MKKWVLATAAAAGLAGSAQAAVITLQTIGNNGPNDFTWTYQGSLGPDEGLRAGDKLIIYDFGGYVDGSIFANSPDIATSVEYTTPGGLVTPGFADDPALANLVFTYTGPDFRNTGGPYAPLNFDGIGAQSTLGGIVEAAFYTLTTKNNGGENTSIFTLGSVSTPFNAIPEPANWAMLLGGFGLLGFSMRRRGAGRRVTA